MEGDEGRVYRVQSLVHPRVKYIFSFLFLSFIFVGICQFGRLLYVHFEKKIKLISLLRVTLCSFILYT